MRKPAKPKVSNKIKRAPGARTNMRMSPLEKLIFARALNVFEHTAADEIIAAHSMATGMAVSRDPSLNLPRPLLNFDSADERAAQRSDLLKAFPTWKSELMGTEVLSTTLAVLIAEQDPREIDAINHQRKGTAKEQLIAALRHFAALRGNAPKGARREWNFTNPAKRAS